ncbi:MAG: hypothetical protein IPN29_14840 [Saprospiraceae bacterium]|nr:hypothetical protein [Saprospiraceae bacterium]
MPVVVLNQPFIRHYAGVVLDLAEDIFVSGWDEDVRVREKMNFLNSQCYLLPDDGKGRPVLLPLDHTKVCPPQFLKEIDLCSGPCRVTSVSTGLSKDLVNHHSEPISSGLGSVILNDADQFTKNLIMATPSNLPDINRLLITDLKTNSVRPIAHLATDRSTGIDASLLLPGFYRIELLKDMSIQHQFTFIKLYAFNVLFNKADGRPFTEKTIW